MPPFDGEDEIEREDDEDDLRSQLQANFERWDAGELTPENAHSLEPKAKVSTNTTERREAEGAASGSRLAGGAQQQSSGQAATPAATEARPASTPASGDRPRNADGTFATKASDTAATPAPSATQQQAGTPAQAQPTPTAEGRWDREAPQTFSDAGKEAWANLHPELRAHLADTDRQHQQALSTLGEPLLPLNEVAQQHGISWQDGLEKMVSAQRFLDRDPMGAMLWLAQSHGINLDELADRAAGMQPQNGAQPQSNPQLTSALAPLAQQVNQLQSRIEQRDNEARAARRDASIREVNQFASQNPHFSKVETEVFALIPAVRHRMPNATSQEVLKEAYSRAIYAHPEVRATVIAEERRAEEARRTEENRQKVRTSRAAAILTDHRGGGLPTSAPNGELSLQDEIRTHWDAWEAQRA
jgi:hypothetical protein